MLLTNPGNSHVLLSQASVRTCGIAGMFTAALLYPTSVWGIVAVNSALILLTVATMAVSLGRLDKSLWLPFCFVGWLYLLLSFPLANARLPTYLPSKYVSYALNSSELEPIVGWIDPLERSEFAWLVYDNPFNPGETSYKVIVRIRYFTDILDALFALIAGGIAGVIASYWVHGKGSELF